PLTAQLRECTPPGPRGLSGPVAGGYTEARRLAMNKIERVDAVLAGRQPDPPPLSFLYHFGSQAIARPRAVAAHVQHVETYDLDFLKVMDDNRYPRPATPSGVIACAADLDRLQPLQGDEDSFGRQLELITQLARHFAGQLRMVTTVFNS